MKTNVLFVAVCATMLACSNNSTVPNRVELPGTVDNEVFAANVESISVMNLQMDDDWTLSGFYDLELRFTNNYIYLFDDQQIRLMCFDQKTGEKLSACTIKGRGPGEINGLNSMFCFGDTLCIQDTWNRVLCYDRNCKFLSILHEFEAKGLKQHILRLNNGKYAQIWLTRLPSDTEQSAIILTDKSFKTISTHFETPKDNVYIYPADGKPYIANNDTIRFFFPCDNHLYSLCGNTEQCTELVLPNPLTPQIIIKMIKSTGQIEKMYDYDGFFGGLGESGRFLFFKYQMGKNNYISMFDKHTNSAVSIKSDDDDNLVNNIIRHSVVSITDGKFIYALCRNSDLAKYLEGHDAKLNACLKQTQAEYRAFLERNANYIKGLESEEREVANVLIKIKLKD